MLSVLFAPLALGSLVAGCSGSTPFDKMCDFEAACAQENEWQFSESECREEARFDYERAKSSGCDDEMQSYADCVEELELACTEDVNEKIVDKCGAKLESYGDCLENAEDDQRKERGGDDDDGDDDSSGWTSSSSSSGAGSSSSSSSGSSGDSARSAAQDYCSTLYSCSMSDYSACLTQQESKIERATSTSCEPELVDYYRCGARSCTNIGNMSSYCATEATAFDNCTN